MLLEQDTCKDSRFLAANPLKRPANWTPINSPDIDDIRTPSPSTRIHESRPTEERRKEHERPARSRELEVSRYYAYDYAQYNTPTSYSPPNDAMVAHCTPEGHYKHQSFDGIQIVVHRDAYTQEKANSTLPPNPALISTTSPEFWSHSGRIRSTSFSLPLLANMEPTTNNYHSRSPDAVAAQVVNTFKRQKPFPYGVVSRSKSPTSLPRGSDSGLNVHGYIVPQDPYNFRDTVQPSLVPSDGGSHSNNLSDIPRVVCEVDRRSTMRRFDETKYARESSHDKPKSLRLPPISFLLSLSTTEATNVLQRHDGARMPFESRETLGNYQPGSNISQILPPPPPLEPGSAAGYSKPAGAMLRPRCTPTSICKASLERGSSLCRYSRTQIHQQSPGATEDRNSFSKVNEERQYPNIGPGIRHGLRQTMSEAEKRARKALQQQRRRKHGPTREPRERFTEEEDAWLVMEKRRLEKEPNKHWTDLEYAHKAKFPNLKDRTLSGLQSRYYRIKKKYPVDPASPGGNGVPSRWDAEVEGRFPEGADSDGDIEDFEMKDASIEGDSSGSGVERV
ncbi:hypothetical protein EV426DRAFT_677807 [Tirmania nivea]|nr:hypothetical protein EV426DRAFT_677807 [Tirmania nivea]